MHDFARKRVSDAGRRFAYSELGRSVSIAEGSVPGAEQPLRNLNAGRPMIDFCAPNNFLPRPPRG